MSKYGRNDSPDSTCPACGLDGLVVGMVTGAWSCRLCGHRMTLPASLSGGTDE